MIKGKCPHCKKEIKVTLPSYRKPINTYDQAMLGTLVAELKDLIDSLGKIATSTALLSGAKEKAIQLLGVIDNVKSRS